MLGLHDRTKNIDHDGLCAFGWYHLHIAVAGRSWIRIGDREWEIVGTRTELGIGYDIRRLSNRHRHLFQRKVLLAELLPAASGQMIKEMAESGWWPEHAHQRPPGMWRSRFRNIQESLRWTGKHIPRGHVHRGREQWERWKHEKLPPPPAAVIDSGVEPESAAEAFFRQVYGEKLK